jgi:DNA-binding PadR family transcriptional regulator
MILTTLAEGGPKHGYVIMTEIQRNFDVQLGPGTLYGALTRLNKLGLIESVASEDRRQPYRVTPAGTAWLNSELIQLHKVASSGLRIIEGVTAKSERGKETATGSVEAV